MQWLEPLHDRLVVKRDTQPEKTEGGLIIPESAQTKLAQGLVVQVGRGKTLDNGGWRPNTVNSGQTVLFSRYAGEEVVFGTESFVVLREEDVLGIVHNYPST